MSSSETQTIRRLQRLRAGEDPRTPSLDHKANLLFERHRSALRAYCRSYVRNPARAEELTNEVLLIGWRRIESYNHTGSFKSWLLGIARFTCLRALEKKKDLLVDDHVLDPADPSARTLSIVTKNERGRLLRSAIADMTEEEQRAIYMRYYEGLPIDQITETLALPGKAGAKGLLKRCKDRLARRLRTAMEGHELRTSFWLT